MKLVPRTLFGQVLLALVLGFFVAQAVGVWLLLEERSRFGDRLLGGYAAQRIAGVVSLLADADAADREKLVRALNVPPTRVTLAEPWRDGQAKTGEDARAFSERLAQELGRERTFQVLSIVRAPGGRPKADPGRPTPGDTDERGSWRAPESSRVMEHETRSVQEPAGVREPGRWKGGRRGGALLLAVVQVQLGDGAVATFRNAVPQTVVDRPLRVLAWVAGTWLLVAIVVGWTVRRLTRPLAGLAEAASKLARNLDQPPVPESGPLEVARAARAFNAMQRDLKGYLETRAQAMAGVSHDLRLPLTRVRLRLEGIPDASLRQAIERDLGDMEVMIGATLDYLRAGASTEQPIRVDADALVEGVADDMEALGATVRVHGRAGAPILARPNALRRCLANLMDNARLHGGGEIDVTLSAGGAALVIRIEDRGPGIPAAQREHVFEPYVRLDPSRARHCGGTGLGLAIARAVARAHGGEIKLEDRVAGGLAVVLTLPRTSVPGAAPGGTDR